MLLQNTRPLTFLQIVHETAPFRGGFVNATHWSRRRELGKRVGERTRKGEEIEINEVSNRIFKGNHGIAWHEREREKDN